MHFITCRFSEAVNSISFKMFLSKMKLCNFPDMFINWIKTLLSKYSFMTLVNCYLSLRAWMLPRGPNSQLPVYSGNRNIDPTYNQSSRKLPQEINQRKPAPGWWLYRHPYISDSYRSCEITILLGLNSIYIYVSSWLWRQTYIFHPYRSCEITILLGLNSIYIYASSWLSIC